MPSLNTANLEIQISKNIPTANTQQLLMLAKSAKRLKNGILGYVCYITDLPDPYENRELLYFVEDSYKLFQSDGCRWSEAFQSTVPQSNGAMLHFWGTVNGSQNGLPAMCLPDTAQFGTAIQSPTREPTSDTWCSFGMGRYSSHGIKTDGTLWSWGYNGYANLADGTTTNRSRPSQEGCKFSDWVCAQFGYKGGVGLRKNGTLWSWGEPSAGQLGNNGKVFPWSGYYSDNACYPVQEITSSYSWNNISKRWQHTLATKTDGSLWGWGCNLTGMLGDNSTTNRSSPVREISSSSNWCDISAGCRLSVGIKNDGSLWSWGCNNAGQLGNLTIINASSPIREILSSTQWKQASAWKNVLAVKDDGSMWGWGCNNDSLGLGDLTARSSPTREATNSNLWCFAVVGQYASFAIKKDGSLWVAAGDQYCAQGPEFTEKNFSVSRVFVHVDVFSPNTNVCVYTVDYRYALLKY